jgi:hypothetical protein
MQKYIKYEIFWDNPHYVLIRILQRILIVNRNISQRKKGVLNMIIFLFINLFIAVTQVLLAYSSVQGSHVAAKILLFFLVTEFGIKVIFMFIQSKSFLYALFISTPVISWILPLGNIFYKIKKP